MFPYIRNSFIYKYELDSIFKNAEHLLSNLPDSLFVSIANK